MSIARRIACAFLLMVPVAAISAVEFTDFDDDVMRAMDDAFKDLEPVLGASNADGAKEDIAILKEGYQWTQEYFTDKKELAPEALNIVLAGQKLLGDVESATTAGDFAAAVTSARELQKNCKSCHDKYKSKKQ